MEAFRVYNRRTARRLEAWQAEVHFSSASTESEKDDLIESLLERNAILLKQVAIKNTDALEIDNEMKACELAKQYELNEIKTFYIKQLETQMVSLKLKDSNSDISDLLNKLTTDEHTQTIISKIAVLHETLLTFKEKEAKNEAFEERNREFEAQIREAKFTNLKKSKLGQNPKLLQHETELMRIKDELQANLMEKREAVERMTSVLKKSFEDVNNLLSKHMLDIMEQVQTFEKLELSPLLNKLANTEKTQVEKYQEILKVLREPDDINSSESLSSDPTE